jgi:predicted dienelactone hydrolase
MSRRHGTRSVPALRPAGARRLALAVLAAGALVAGCSAAPGSPAAPGTRATATPSPTPRPPARPPIGVIGTYAVGTRTLRLAESAHTGPGGAQVGARVLPALVRYPAATTTAAAGQPAAGPFPLIVFAPGFIQCGSVYRNLLHAWASAGYVVAVVTFPRTNCDVSEETTETDLVNQPADLSFVITQLTEISARPTGPLAGLIDPAKIAVAGHSDGGDTVAAVAGGTCCADRRVKAAIVLAGAEWPALGATYFKLAAPPVLFVQGSADPINPPAASQQLYQADTTGTRYYLDVFGAGHLTPYEGDSAQEQLVARVTTEFLNRYLAGQPAARAAMARAGDVAGLAELFHGGRLPG